MEGSCSGTSERSWAEDDFTDLLLPGFLREMLDEDLYKHQEEENCELCPLNTHSESAQLRWDLPGTDKMSTLSDSHWESILSDAKDGQWFNADEDPEIKRATKDAKKECDLLSAESTLFKNLRWQVLFSDNFRKSFQNLRLSSIKKLVINLLLKLARGWRPKKVNVDWKCENSSYILKQFKVGIYYVVCSIDIMKDSVYKQVFKVWDILPMTDTTKLLNRIDSIASLYTDEFISHCNEKLFERNFEVPLSWPLSSDIFRFKDSSNTKLDSGADTGSVECRTYAENSKIIESMLLVKFYPLSSCTVSHLLSDVEDKGAGLPFFEITDEEREIIYYTRSCFILGRSGTGKTTTLTRKLYQTFQKYCIASQCSRAADSNLSITDEVEVGLQHGGSVLHQIFVTVSLKLCHAVKKSLAQLQSIDTEKVYGDNNFNGVDDVDEVSEFKDIPDTFVGIRQEKYPLIITFQKFLMMLDGTLGKSYFQRFPYVRDSSHSEGTRSVALQTFLRKNEVTYDRFSSIYWPHFNTKLTKGLDASRVFTEIMSHIKGGPLEGEACNFERSRQEYIALSESRISTLCVEQRCAIYDIFKDYEKVKMERGEFDLADFVSDIHLRLKNEDLQGDKMDFVYIDEVQDLTMRQISLFRYICNNVDEGFIFSGDTAQTIARGIDFRFEDIRSLFYNEFLMRPRISDLSGRKKKGLISDVFNLSHNFRTHAGVLRLAQSVVDLICYYFPYSIDMLAPETSHIYGESPIFLEPGTDENLIISIFGHSGKSSGKWVGFGADQVILVRDDSAKKEISKFIGQQALVLTIVECKGLEFQDVLLYNFFGSSPLSNQWRIVYEFLNEKDLVGDSLESFPSFCQSKHNLLCSELKQLYVAITRTKQRLWICENNLEVSKPMLDYWRMLSLVQVTKIDDTLSETMHRASTPEEWKSQGIKLFWEKNYEMAKMCFEKAGDETWAKRAKASGLRAAADSLCGSNPEEAAMMLREAAEIFDSIDRVESAAECFCELGEYERAGRIYWEKCGKSELRKAGECFSLAGKHKLAAEVYESGNFLRDCLSACAKGNHVDLGLQYIEEWKQQALSNSATIAGLMEIDRIVQEFLENCALECHKAKDIASLMKFVRSFCSTESKRKFLKSLDCLEELLVLEEELGNFNEASEIAKILGDTLCEADLLEKLGRFSNACLLILSYVISKVLWVSGNQGWPLKSCPHKLELLDRVMSIAEKVSETFHASVCAQAKILLYEQNNLSELMQFYNASKQYENPIGEILVLRKLLDVHFKANVTKYAWDNDLQLDPRTFDQRMAQNQVSIGALVYLWNLWKVRSLEISECLDSLEKTDSIKLEGVVGFCFDFFGLRLLDNSSITFQLLDPNAAWVKNVEEVLTWQNRHVATLKACDFASAARKFWLQDLVVVGLRVLDALQNLSRSPVAKRAVQYCQGMCLLHIFDIANFLLDLKSVSMKYTDNRKLQDLLQLCMEYFSFVFTPDPRASLHKQMLAFRETELSRNLLEEYIIRQLSGIREFSYYQIGGVVMTMLGNGKLKNSFYETFAEKASNNAFWKLVIENIRRTFEPDSVKESKSGTVCVQESSLTCSVDPLCQSLFWALVLTSKAGNYMCPPCCLYLLERLLILAPHPRGFFFATKSSFVEYLISLPPDASRKTGTVTYNESQTWVLVDFLRFVVQEVLDNRINTHAWLKNYKISYDSYFPVLVLRMFMILCLLSLNWDFPLGIFKRLINNADMKSKLPREFYEALRPKRRGYVFESAVATAFKLISDPLVTVVTGDISREFQSPDAIFLDLKSFSCKSDIMKTLFPKSTQASRDQYTIAEGNKTSIIISPFVDNEGKNTIAESPEVDSKSASHSSLENGNGNLRINWDLFLEISEAFKSCTNRNDENLKSLLLGKKVDVEDHINSITSAVSQFIEQSSHSGEEKHLPYDGGRLIRDLNTLLSLLLTSELDSIVMTTIGELLKRMEESRTQIDSLVSLLVEKNDLDVDKMAAEKTSDRNSNDDQVSKTEANPSNKGAADAAKAKGKNKKKSKPKKGKGVKSKNK